MKKIEKLAEKLVKSNFGDYNRDVSFYGGRVVPRPFCDLTGLEFQDKIKGAAGL